MNLPHGQLETPVALLIFNRPDTTRRVFEAIRQAQPTQVLVVADGPRLSQPGDVNLCAAARAVIDEVDWDCDVRTNYAAANLGCKKRISSGLDWVFSQVEEAIILEDDCVPHPDFFPFCEALLQKYRDDERVMMVSGTNCLRDLDVTDSYFYSRYFNVWGWATWRRAWRKYDVELRNWEELKARGQLQHLGLTPQVARYFTKVFDAVKQDTIDTWDYQWTYACLVNSGLSVVPRVNLVSNIGVTGTHTKAVPSTHPLFAMPTAPLDTVNLRHPRYIVPNAAYDREFFDRFLKKSVTVRIRQRLLALRKSLP